MRSPSNIRGEKKAKLKLAFQALAFCFSMQATCLWGSPADASDLAGGIERFKSKSFDDALLLFDKTVDADPTNAEAHFWRAKCLQQLNKEKEAIAEFKLAAILSADSQLKESCKQELASYKIKMPESSVSDQSKFKSAGSFPASAGGEFQKDQHFFKLSSKKLDWNLEMRQDFLKSMDEKNAKLESLARNGGRWRQPNHHASVDLRAALQSGPAHTNTPLSADERLFLSRSDIAIILDHSGSMQATDCPSNAGLFQSRLSWCVEELVSFADSLLTALPHGFHLITFDDKPEVFQIATAARLKEVVQGLKSGGGTDLAKALREAFRIHSAHPQQPLLIAVVTDAEVEMRSSESTIAEGTRRYPLPNGIFINILQVGITAEIHTHNNLAELDSLHTRAGAAYDAVEGVPFSRLRKDGLPRDLLAALRKNNQANASATSAKPVAAPSISAAGKTILAPPERSKKN